MGVCRCTEHGRQEIVEACAHVAAALNEGCVIPRQRLLEVEVCAACVRELDLLRFSEEQFPNWSDAASECYSIVNASSGTFCHQCVAAVELRFARSLGLPDPFPVYEKTVTYQQREIKNLLLATLKAQFTFRQSLVDPRHLALEVQCGALTYPLSVTIYYVTDRAVQDAILSRVDNVLSASRLPQYRAAFYASEDWHQEGPRGWRGDEPPIRKHESGYT
jgi:hypothetical protein